jgi:hypothetical protein
MLQSRRLFVPGAHQLEMIEHGQEHPRCAFFARMGSGKTSACLTLVHELALVEPGRTLVLAPKRVARDTWPNEAAKWEHLRGMSVLPIVGTEADRIAALKLDVDCHTVNYDVLPWLIEYLLTNNFTWRWSRVVADESTRLKSFRLGGYKKDGTPKGTAGGGERAKAIGRVAHTRVKRWINLTGTPSPQRASSICGDRPGSSTPASASAARSTPFTSAGSATTSTPAPTRRTSSRRPRSTSSSPTSASRRSCRSRSMSPS